MRPTCPSRQTGGRRACPPASYRCRGGASHRPRYARHGPRGRQGARGCRIISPSATGVALVGPGGGRLETQGEVEHILRTCVEDAMVRHGDLCRLTRWHGGEKKCLLLHDVAITQKLIGKVVEVGQVRESQLVAERKGARRSVPVGENSRSIDCLHLSQFGRPRTVGRDDSVVEEIALKPSPTNSVGL